MLSSDEEEEEGVGGVEGEEEEDEEDEEEEEGDTSCSEEEEEEGSEMNVEVKQEYIRSILEAEPVPREDVEMEIPQVKLEFVDDEQRFLAIRKEDDQATRIFKENMKQNPRPTRTYTNIKHVFTSKNEKIAKMFKLAEFLVKGVVVCKNEKKRVKLTKDLNELKLTTDPEMKRVLVETYIRSREIFTAAEDVNKKRLKVWKKNNEALNKEYLERRQITRQNTIRRNELIRNRERLRSTVMAATLDTMSSGAAASPSSATGGDTSANPQVNQFFRKFIAFQKRLAGLQNEAFEQFMDDTFPT